MTRTFAVLAAASVAGCVGPWSGGGLIEEARVAFVYPGPVGDHGWTKAHDDGRQYVQDVLGVDNTARPLVAPPDLGAVIDDLVEEDWNVIFTTSSDFISGTQQAAVDSPERYFLSCCGQVSAPNLNSYFGRMYQALYVAGFAAGRMSCTGRIGVVAAKPSPEFVRHINAIALGARTADPNVVVDVRWIDAFFNLELEAQYTTELVELGADVILTQTDTTVPVETAETLTALCPVDGENEPVPVYSVGYDNVNGCDHGAERCITSAYWNWGPLYADQIRSLLDGTWDPTDVTWQPMTNDSDSAVAIADLAPFVPAGIREEFGALLQETIDGSPQVPFRGPLVDVDGVERVVAGSEMTDAELDRMCWHVSGVISSVGGTDEPARVSATCLGDF